MADAEAKQRLVTYGPNALEEKKVSPLAMFGKFFWGPMPWMIEAAAVMSILVKDWVDFVIILALLLFNAVLGFSHERQAASFHRCDARESGVSQWQRWLHMPLDRFRGRLGRLARTG